MTTRIRLKTQSKSARGEGGASDCGRAILAFEECHRCGFRTGVADGIHNNIAARRSGRVSARLEIFRFVHAHGWRDCKIVWILVTDFATAFWPMARGRVRLGRVLFLARCNDFEQFVRQWTLEL